MPAGTDLSLTLIRQASVPEPKTFRVVGVDDWAERKGQAYGTIVVDLERGTIVDLLPDRTPETVSEWLQKHPGIEIISRDRAGVHAEADRKGAPEATQVADRWSSTEEYERYLVQHAPAVSARHRKTADGK